ncbi:MAG: TetR family transcriptional regulator [Rhodospirillales bacterium]|jgi:AcrR family transcriptional regulator|nr:TetR family transcriptional regulator [Rhodospirillales bacterium]
MSGTERVRSETQAAKRERVLHAAMALFYERGYSATTLDDVAARLGVTKPFIYTYFRGKADLLAALCQPTIALSLQAVAQAAAEPGPPTERLRRAMVDFTRVVLSRQANIAIFFREEKHLEPAALDEINALRKRFDQVLSALLAEGVAAGAFEIADPSLAALAIGGMVSWAYTWYRPNGRMDLETMCGRMAELALNLAGVRLRAAA